MRIKYLTDRLAIIDEPRKPYAYKSNKLRRKLLESNKPWQCEECRSTDNLQAHHIEKTRYIKSSGGYRKQDPTSNHELSNGKILCKSCHHKLHNTK